MTMRATGHAALKQLLRDAERSGSWLSVPGTSQLWHPSDLAASQEPLAAVARLRPQDLVLVEPLTHYAGLVAAHHREFLALEQLRLRLLAHNLRPDQP